MPTYAYGCTRCGSEFEVFQKMSDPSLTECEECGGELRRKIFPVGIAFKGPGFYVNDYAGGSRASTAAPAAETSTAPVAEATKSEPAAPAAAAAAGSDTSK